MSHRGDHDHRYTGSDPSAASHVTSDPGALRDLNIRGLGLVAALVALGGLISLVSRMPLPL
jgi:hypothetical protein